MGKKRKFVRKAISGILSFCMIMSFGMTASATGADTKGLPQEPDQNIIFEDDFNSYELGDAAAGEMPKYKDLKNMAIVDGEAGDKAAQIVNGGYFEIDDIPADRQIEFDFKYDQPYSRWGGLYVKAYKGSGEYYFSLNPQFSTRIFISYGTENLAENKSKVMNQDTWYTCKAVLEGKKMSVKVWERDTEEPADWDLSYVKENFVPEEKAAFSLQVDTLGTATKTLVDNVKISTLDTSSKVQLDVTSSDPEKGEVSGGGSFNIGEMATVTAKEKPNYRFVSWTEDGNIVSTDRVYTFEVTGRRSLAANFEELGEPEYEYFADDYESYEEGPATKDNMPPKYVRIDEGYSISSLENNKTLKMNTIDGSNRSAYLDCDLIDKQVQFDFYYDKDFTSHDGFYVKLHAQPNSGGADNEYYFSINPNFGNTNLIVSCNTTNLTKTQKSMSKETWYTCKSRIYGSRIMVKIWETGTKEPGTWDTNSELKGFELKADGTRFKVEYVDRTGKVNGYIDNFSVKTWEQLAEKASYKIEVKANDDSMGTVEGSGTYLEENEVTVKAKPNKNYKFVNWTDEQGVEVSKEEEYKFYVGSDRILTANFKEAELEILSFTADGLTQLAEIDANTKTVNLRFSADTDLANVKPAFYYEPGFIPSVLPYETMDLSGGKVEFDGWTINAAKNGLMKEIFVHPGKGNDSNSGDSVDQPFATIERAQQAVREIDGWTGDVIVHIAKGEYALNETLEFTAQDGADKGYAVIYAGAGANDTVLSGGIKLTDWKESKDISGMEGVFETSVPEGVEYSRDLYVGNKRAVMAQETCNGSEISNRNDYGYVVTGKLAEMKSWRNQSDIEFTYDVGWTSNILPVQEVKEEDGTVKVIMKPEPFKNSAIKLNCNPNKPTVIQGAFELLDEENEWYFDREAGKIYYIPEAGADPNEMNIVLPRLEKLAEIKGESGNKVYGLALKDMGFHYTSFMRPHIDGQIELQASFVFDPDMKATNNHDNFLKTPGSVTAAYVEGMHVNNCIFGMLSAAGFDYEVGVTGSTITQSRFEQIGAAGIQVGGVRVRDAQPYSDITYEQGVLNESAGADPERITEDVLVFSNALDTIGNNFKGSIGIWAGYVRDCTIAQNQVTNVAYSGISAGWGWGIWDKGGRADQNYYKFDTPSIQERYLIENNNITNCMNRLNDGGAIYTLSNMPGTVIRGNFIHDIPAPYGAIYLDEGTGGVVDISHNVVYNVWRPYFYHTVAHYAQYEKESQEAQHDNFFTAGEPTNPEDPALMAIKAKSGPVEGMVPPELGAPSEDPVITELKVVSPAKVSYQIGDEFDPTGMKVTAIYSDGSEQDVTAEAQTDGFDSSSAGEKTITVSYGGASATFKVTVAEKKPVKKEILQKTYNYALTLSTEGVVDSAVKFFEDAKQNAEAVLINPEATQTDVNEAWNMLVDAIHGLGIYQGDAEMLRLLIDKADEMTAEKDKYVDTNWSQLEDALTQAKELLGTGDALEEDIEKVSDQLLNAILQQKLKANKDNLNGLIERAQKIDLTGYTKESVAALNQALGRALAVMNDEKLSSDDQETVDKASTELKRALDGLVAKNENNGGNGGNGDNGNNGNAGNGNAGNGNTGNGSNGNNNAAGNKDNGNANVNKGVKTGDSSPVMILITAMLLCLAAGTGVVVAMKRKAKKSK